MKRALLVSMVMGALLLPPTARAYLTVGKAKIDRQIESQDLTVDLVQLDDGTKCVITREKRSGSVTQSCNITASPLK